MAYTDEDAALIEGYGFELRGKVRPRENHYWSHPSSGFILIQPNDPDLKLNPPGRWNLDDDHGLDLFFDTAAQALAWAALNGHLS